MVDILSRKIKDLVGEFDFLIDEGITDLLIALASLCRNLLDFIGIVFGIIILEILISRGSGFVLLVDI